MVLAAGSPCGTTRDSRPRYARRSAVRPRPILTLSGRRIDAAEALRIGLVAEVVPAAELMDIVGRLARDIARGPREALIRTKAKAVRRMGIDVGMATLAM